MIYKTLSIKETKVIRNHLDCILKNIQEKISEFGKMNYVFSDTTKYNLATYSDGLNNQIMLDVDLYFNCINSEISDYEIINEFINSFKKLANYEDDDFYVLDGRFILLKFKVNNQKYTANITIADKSLFGNEFNEIRSDRTIYNIYKDKSLAIEDYPMQYKVYDLKQIAKWENFINYYLKQRALYPFTNQRVLFHRSLNQYYLELYSL